MKLRWPIQLSFQLIIPDYPFILSHRRSTAFPLETYPLHSKESFPTTFFRQKVLAAWFQFPRTDHVTVFERLLSASGFLHPNIVLSPPPPPPSARNLKERGP